MVIFIPKINASTSERYSMKKGQKRWVNDLACTLNYQGNTRKCFAQDFMHLRLQAYQAIRRAFKLSANLNIDLLDQVSQNEWHGHIISVCGRRIDCIVIDRKDRIREAASLLGQIGGQSGTGKSKVRGDSNYYRLLRAKRTIKESRKYTGKE